MKLLSIEDPREVLDERRQNMAGRDVLVEFLRERGRFYSFDTARYNLKVVR